ncbi:MAG: amidase [Chloroflexi bacterium]|nr:amidase [Chloroflexota bacterium]
MPDYLGIEFTPEEREQISKSIEDQLKHLQTIRSHHLDNGIPPALIFDPRLPTPVDMPAIAPINVSDIGQVQRPSNLEDAAFYPVTHLAQLVKSRQVTSVELTEMYLERLREYNLHLECVVTFTDDLAMTQAQQADEEIAAGHYRGPLHGIPWGAKDLLAVPGYPTTWGATPFKSQVIDRKATVVQRLEEAGAVLIAKLTLGALAYGDIWFDGVTKNPWDLSEGSSGSSAGSAASVAAGLVGFAIGTETYGSIVSPSTRCGVTGLRPTFGRVSRHGAMALCWSMDKIGPIARSVEDCAVVFNAIHGADGLDNHAISHPFRWNPDLDIHSLRIGYYKSAFEAERDNQANDDAVLEVLDDLGIDLIPIEMPEIDIQSLIIILVAEAAAAFDELTRHNLDDQMKWQDDDAWPNTFRRARYIPAVEYINANRIRTELMQAFAVLMEEVDVFVTPSFGKDVLLATNLTGHPAVVLPNGFTEKGTKTSISCVGGLFEDEKVLAVAKAYQDASDFHQQHPPLDF